eukprot:TRINITY_DN29741_c0_g1_i3.p1 TRINITY_DN29741_c0_g1~~TRINITY_DN29741_c0_g1_i3.p1  ORF type:complete len:207 (+),score=-22.78 TRINITY_DN29741_c0_g1_i3:53-622(+)
MYIFKYTYKYTAPSSIFRLFAKILQRAIYFLANQRKSLYHKFHAIQYLHYNSSIQIYYIVLKKKLDLSPNIFKRNIVQKIFVDISLQFYRLYKFGIIYWSYTTVILEVDVVITGYFFNTNQLFITIQYVLQSLVGCLTDKTNLFRMYCTGYTKTPFKNIFFSKALYETSFLFIQQCIFFTFKIVRTYNK